MRQYEEPYLEGWSAPPGTEGARALDGWSIPGHPVFWTYAQTAERLGVSKQTVLRLVTTGELPAVEVGRRCHRILESDLAEWAASHRTQKRRA